MAGGTKTDATYDLGQGSFRWRDIYTSRQIVSAVGSVGTPAYSYAGRTTDGWYSSAANQQALALGGSAWLVHRDNSGTTHTDGGQSWTDGIDVADSNAWKISVGSNLATVTALKITTAGEVLKPLQPCFYGVRLAATSITSSGAVAGLTITGYTTQFDVNGDYTNSVFTAPVPGKYFFSSVLDLTSVPKPAGNNGSLLHAIFTTGVTFGKILPEILTTTSNRVNDTHTVVADMTAGDKAMILFNLNTTTGANISGCRFFGYLIG